MVLVAVLWVRFPSLHFTPAIHQQVTLFDLVTRRMSRVAGLYCNRVVPHGRVLTWPIFDGTGGRSLPSWAFVRMAKAASLLAWIAFCLHIASESAKAESNQAANLVLMLGDFALISLVASKLPIWVAQKVLVVFWNLGTFLFGLARYSVGPKTLSGILG